MPEKEGFIPEEEIKKIIIPKKGELAKLLGLEPEQEKPAKEKISKEAYTLEIIRAMEVQEAIILKAELAIGQLRGNLDSMRTFEALNHNVQCYKEKGFISFEAKPKPKVGFTKDEV